MELRQLRYLVAVTEEGTFTQAAATMHVAQPGVSAQIRELERELGEALLDRSAQPVRPTQAGAAVLPYARAALAAVTAARLAVDELRGLIRGRVTLGTVASIASVDLPGLLAGFHRLHPGVQIALSESTSGQLASQLRAGGLDLAFLGTAPAAEDLAAHLVADEALAAVVAAGHPLARRRAVTVPELRDRPLVAAPPGTGLRASLDDACARAGFRPQVAFESGDPRTLTRFAALGLGIAIVPEAAARAAPGAVHSIAITRPQPRTQLFLAWNDGRPAGRPTRALSQHLRAALPGPPR